MRHSWLQVGCAWSIRYSFLEERYEVRIENPLGPLPDFSGELRSIEAEAYPTVRPLIENTCVYLKVDVFDAS